MGMEQPESDLVLTSKGASMLIEQLKEAVLDTSNRPEREVREVAVAMSGDVNLARLGMAMKEVYRNWKGRGYDVCNGQRDRFIAECMDTYELFSEVAQWVEGA